jgi:hypothetical protein
MIKEQKQRKSITNVHDSLLGKVKKNYSADSIITNYETSIKKTPPQNLSLKNQMYQCSL